MHLFNGITYSPLLEHISKIEIDKDTSPSTISYLMKANPHTIKINGKYSNE